MDTWACEIIQTNLNLCQPHIRSACDLTCDKEPGNEYSMYRNFVIVLCSVLSSVDISLYFPIINKFDPHFTSLIEQK